MGIDNGLIVSYEMKAMLHLKNCFSFTQTPLRLKPNLLTIKKNENQ